MPRTSLNIPVAKIPVFFPKEDFVEISNGNLYAFAEFIFSWCPLIYGTGEDDPLICHDTNQRCTPGDGDCWLLKIIERIKKHITENIPPKEKYQEYLKSEHWQETRLKALKHYSNHCNLCNSQNNLNVHHNNYDRLGCEEMMIWWHYVATVMQSSMIRR